MQFSCPIRLACTDFATINGAMATSQYIPSTLVFPKQPITNRYVSVSATSIFLERVDLCNTGDAREQAPCTEIVLNARVLIDFFILSQ